MSLQTLIEDLEHRGRLKNRSLREAFERIDRKDFVGAHNHAHAYHDTALPIGYGATISQPYTVALMLELLDPQPGERVLDVGSGSGWTTALIGHLVGGQGSVIATETKAELVAFGRKNLMQYVHLPVDVRPAGTALGLPDEAPFDRILVSAAAKEFPHDLLAQLKVGGVMVIPIRSVIVRAVKKPGDNYSKEEFPGFSFVPLES